MEFYALNHWDAYIYAYGSNLINVIFSSPVWKALVVIFTVFAIVKTFPVVKKSSNIPGAAIKNVGAIFLFSAITLWPVKMPLDIYTVTKASAYTNVFKWILPSGRHDKFTATPYLNTEVDISPVVAVAGKALGYIQFWSMWVVDYAGRSLGTGSISSGNLLAAAKLSTVQKQVSQGLDGVVGSIQAAGQWTPDDQAKYVQMQDRLGSFFEFGCIGDSKVAGVWQDTVGGNPPSIDYLLNNINPSLSGNKRQTCRLMAEGIRNTATDICTKWSQVNNGAPPSVCENLVKVSLSKRMHNAWTKVKGVVKSLPGEIVGLLLTGLKKLVIGFAMALAGIANILLLGGIATIAPISIGIVNLFIFFLSPLFFLTQLVQGKFIDSTVRIGLEMLWARLLYAVFVLAYVITTILQGPAWKALLGTTAGTTGSTAMTAGALVSGLGGLALTAGGAVILSFFFTHMAITIAAGMIVLWFGAQMLRTLIFGEFLHITNILDAGQKHVKVGFAKLLPK